MQPLGREILGRILRQIEVRADVRSTRAIQLVTGETLHGEQDFAGAGRIRRWQRRTRRRGQASATRAKANSPILQHDTAIARSGCCRPRPRSKQCKTVPRSCRFPESAARDDPGVDCKPGDGLAVIGIEHEVGRKLRDETVERDRLYHAVGRQRHSGEQSCNPHGAIRHRQAISVSRTTSIVVASARAKSSPRVKLRLLSPTVMVIVGSSARARPGASNRLSRTRARTKARVRSRNDMASNRNLRPKSRRPFFMAELH